jgi:hypothetical protein
MAAFNATHTNWRQTTLAIIGFSLITGASAAGQLPVGTTYTQSITQLKASRELLHKANHDYQGYRAKAVHQITLAIHALEGTKPPAKGPYKQATGQASGHELQSVSDAQLAKAVQQLQTVQTQLVSMSGPNVIVASGHVSKAIEDLQTALKIK